MKELTKTQKAILEREGWTITDTFEDGRVEIAKASPAGEDFSAVFDVDGLQQDVDRYARDFDIDEHVEMWIQARREGVSGVPSSSELVEDAKAIKEMLGDLAEALRPVYKANIEVSGTVMKDIIDILTKTRTERLSATDSHGTTITGLFENGVTITVEIAVGSDGDEKGGLYVSLLNNGKRVVGDLPADWYEPGSDSLTDWAEALSDAIYLGEDVDEDLAGEYRYTVVVNADDLYDDGAEPRKELYLAFADVSTVYIDPNTGKKHVYTKARKKAGLVMATDADAAQERVRKELSALYQKDMPNHISDNMHLTVDNVTASKQESEWYGDAGIAGPFAVAFVMF